MLPKINPANDNVGSKPSEQKRDEIFNKIAASLRTSTIKPVSDQIVTKIVSNFTESLHETNKDLLETLLEEDKKLLKETVDAISKLQGKNEQELDKLLALAEKIILSGQTNKNQPIQGVGERLKETVLQGKYDAAGATLSGDQDTLKNRILRSMTGTTPEQAKVQGTTVFGNLRKTSSRAFREGMGSIFVSDEERREDIRAKAERENKQIALAQQSASDFGKILDSSGKNINNSPDSSKFETNGEEVTTNLSNPEASIDAATKSDAQELAAGIRDTDPSFSRSMTESADPWEQRWNDLLDLLNKIKDCVCQCQCTDQQAPMDIDLPDGRRRPGQRQPRQMRGRGRIGTAIKVGVGALAAGAAGAAAYGSGALSGAYDYVKDKLGFGSKTPATSTPESMPGRTNPNAPATEVTRTRPGTVDTRAPRTIPTPANDPGVRIPRPANDDERFVEEQKKRVNQRQQPQGPSEEPAPRKQGTAEPANRTRTPPPSAANDSPSSPRAEPSKRGFFSRVLDRAKSLVGMGEKPATAAAQKGTGRVVAKAAGKSLLKKIPGVSILAGLGFGAQRALQGDFVGAGLEVASGAAGTVPFLGTAASLGIDASLAARDMGALGGNPTTAANSAARPATTAANSAARPSMFSRLKSFGGRAVGSLRSVPSRTGTLLRSAGSSIASTGRAVGSSLAPAGRFAGRVLGKVALPLAAGMAAYDAYKGYNADENATTGQKFRNAGRNILSGLTFGMVDSTEDKIASGDYRGSQIKPKTTSAGLETGKNQDASYIERGTDKTAPKQVINVPPPTVIQAPSKSDGGQQIISGGSSDRMNARPADSSWLRFQQKRAVA
jgi:ribosomal protein S17E